MFTEENVNNVINELKNIDGFFVSEAHLQLQFAITASKIFNNQFDFIPEFPAKSPIEENKRTEFDLLVFDKKTKEQTLIEFKYKTKNSSRFAKKKQRFYFPIYDGSTFEPANHSAQDLNRYDCWKDIYRIESNIYDNNPKITNGFFIFLTNDELYIKETGTDLFGHSFSLTQGEHLPEIKTINKEVKESSAGKFRLTHSLTIKNKYNFNYNIDTPFKKFETSNYNNIFWLLIVPINKIELNSQI